MTIVFSELAGDTLVPTIAVETDLDSGKVSLPTKTKTCLLVGYKLAAGSGTNGLPYRITSLARAVTLFGEGSQLAVMVEAALRVSRSIPLYAMSYAEGSGVQATANVVLATTATGPGTLSVWIAGRLFTVGVEATDTPTIVGDALAAAINAAYNLPVTAVNTTGTVAITSRQKGTEGNSIRLRCEMSGSPGMTATASAAQLATGTLVGDPTSVLAGIEASRYHIIGLGCADDTNAGLLKTHVEKVSSALEQRWCFGIVGTTEASAGAITLAGSIKSYRMQVVWMESSDQPEFEIVGAFAALRALEVNRNKTLDWRMLTGIKAPNLETAWPTRADEQVALEGGIVPLRPMRDGTVQVVRNVITQTTSPAFRDAEPQEISDYIDEDLIAQAKNRFAGQALKVSSPAGTPGVLTPDRFRALLHERMRIWDQKLDYTQGAETDIAAGTVVAEPNASDPCRLDVGYPFRPVFGAHVIAIVKSFTLPEI